MEKTRRQCSAKGCHSRNAMHSPTTVPSITNELSVERNSFVTEETIVGECIVFREWQPFCRALAKISFCCLSCVDGRGGLKSSCSLFKLFVPMPPHYIHSTLGKLYLYCSRRVLAVERRQRRHCCVSFGGEAALWAL